MEFKEINQACTRQSLHSKTVIGITLSFIGILSLVGIILALIFLIPAIILISKGRKHDLANGIHSNFSLVMLTISYVLSIPLILIVIWIVLYYSHYYIWGDNALFGIWPI